MKLHCVFSTLTASNEYADYTPPSTPGQSPIKGDSVIIKGGAGVANAHLQTPRGVPTMVTEAQIALLKRNEVFKLHEKNGFVTIAEVERPPTEDAVEKAVAAMTGRDNAAPLVDADFIVNGAKPPTVNDGEAVAAAKRTRATAAA
jgi:hypothetical protein